MAAPMARAAHGIAPRSPQPATPRDGLRIVCLALLALGLAAPHAHAVDPALKRVLPPGGQIGTEITLELQGDRLADAEEILFYAPGLSVLEWLTRDEKRATARLAIAADAPIGEHCLRLRTRTGQSELVTFWVGRLPIVDEHEPNGSFAAPQRLTGDVTVHGVIENEDVDHFAIDARQGERISVEIEGIRLGRTLFDPSLALFDERRVEIAGCDDSAMFVQDGFLSLLAPADGSFVLQVRDASFAGNTDCVYRLHVGSFPRPSVVFPTGGRPGSEVDVTFLGDPRGPITAKVKLPGSPPSPFGLFAEDAEGLAPSWNVFRASGLGDAIEVEPNDTPGQATAVGEDRRAFSGVLDPPGDVDCFRFPAAAGEHLLVRILARFLGSPVDGMLWVYDPSGKQVDFNDDRNGPDGNIEIAATVAGDYTVKIADHLGIGGPLQVYRLEAITLRPGLSLGMPRFGRDSQPRQVIPVPRGGRYAATINVNRRDFAGDVGLSAEGLPAGMSLQGTAVAGDLRARVVVFEATADAPLAGSLVDLLGDATDPALKIRGRFSHTLELVVAPPNQTVFYRCTQSRLPVAITERAPFTIDLAAPTVPLVRNGMLDLRVTVRRDDGFDAPITVRMVWKPDGVGAPSTISIGKGETEGTYSIDANGTARLGVAELAVLGEVSVDGGTLINASALVPITVAEPFLTASMDLTAIPLGGSGEVFVKLTPGQPFTGTAVAQLMNLPPHVTAAELSFASGDAGLAFQVQTDDKTPKGKHKNLFCRVVIEQDGQPIVHNVAFGGSLRIDPAPVAAEVPPPPPPPATATPVATPRLSRLEQLRQEAQARAAARVAPKSKPDPADGEP